MTTPFPADFLWGVATAGHQVEGDNVTSDTWFLEHVSPTVFREPSGHAANCWELWESDLDLVQGMGLNAYRFSVEWARDRARRGRVLGGGAGALRGGRRRMSRPGPRSDRHVQPLHVAALVRDARRMARPGVGGPVRPLLRRGDGPLRRPDRARRHPQRARPPRDAQLGGTCPPSSRSSSARRSRRRHARPGSNATAPATSCCARTSPAMRAGMTARATARRVPRSRSAAPICRSASRSRSSTTSRVPGGEAVRDRKRAEVYEHWLEVAREDDFIGVQNYERAVLRRRRAGSPGPGCGRRTSRAPRSSPTRCGRCRVRVRGERRADSRERARRRARRTTPSAPPSSALARGPRAGDPPTACPCSATATGR